MSSDLYHAISQAQAAYARCIDLGEFERWPQFFEDQCLYVVTTADNHAEGLEAGLIYADSKGMLADRISALREANIYEQHSYRHILGQPFLLGQEGDEVRGETSFLVVRIMRTGESSVFASGRYLDRYRVGGDAPKLIERIAVCDSSRIDTLLALPL
jgi:anthranilate 1,2-dioxygenase small subunit